MNEPKRYTHTIHDTAEGMESAFFGPHGLFAPQGEFVKYEDYKQLQAEVERLNELANDPYRLSKGWRPIETAPKDGTWVMLATDNPDKPSGIESLDCWFPDVCQGRYCDGWMRCSEYSVNITPTHWMPLLKPPIQ